MRGSVAYPVLHGHHVPGFTSARGSIDMRWARYTSEIRGPDVVSNCDFWEIRVPLTPIVLVYLTSASGRCSDIVWGRNDGTGI